MPPRPIEHQQKDYTTPGTYRIYWDHNGQRDYYDKEFKTREDYDTTLARDTKRGYHITRICRLTPGA